MVIFESSTDLDDEILQNFDARTAYYANDLAWVIAGKLDDERVKQGLSYRALAEKMGTSKTTVCRLLKKDGYIGGLTLRTIVRAADALGVRLALEITAGAQVR
jgi:DNA-binding phage protein